MRQRDTRGQSTVEYAIVIAVVIAALLAMQIYVKRGAMGRLHDASDQLGEQYTPMSTTAQYNRTYNVSRNEQTTAAGQTTSQISSPETQTRAGSETEQAGLDQEKLY